MKFVTLLIGLLIASLSKKISPMINNLLNSLECFLNGNNESRFYKKRKISNSCSYSNIKWWSAISFCSTKNEIIFIRRNKIIK